MSQQVFLDLDISMVSDGSHKIADHYLVHVDDNNVTSPSWYIYSLSARSSREVTTKDDGLMEI
jgi:hypothetical protein